MLTTNTGPVVAGATRQERVAAEHGPLSATLPAETAPADTSGTPEAEEGAETLVLFSLNGRDYTVPKRVGPNVALRYLRDIRRHGQEHAIAGLMEALLGAEAMDALADYDDLTEEDLESVMKAVQTHVLGPLEKHSGKR